MPAKAMNRIVDDSCTDVEWPIVAEAESKRAPLSFSGEVGLPERSVSASWYSGRSKATLENRRNSSFDMASAECRPTRQAVADLERPYPVHTELSGESRSGLSPHMGQKTDGGCTGTHNNRPGPCR